MGVTERYSEPHMDFILICTGLSSPLEDGIRSLIGHHAAENHWRFFSHPLLGLPMPLLPIAIPNWHVDCRELSLECLLDGREREFTDVASSPLCLKVVLDEWVEAASRCMEREDADGRIVIIVDALCYKMYERWALSRGFDRSNLISTGRSLLSQESSFASDVAQGASKLQQIHMNRHSVLEVDARKCVVGRVQSMVPMGDGGRSIADWVVEHVVPAPLERPADDCSQSPTVIVASSREEAVNVTSTLVASEPIQLGTAAEAHSAVGKYWAYLSRTRAHGSASIPRELISQLPLPPHHDHTAWTFSRRGVVSRRCYARVGIVGNPSDNFNGKTLSATISNFWVEMHIWPSATLRIASLPFTDPTEFKNIADLFAVCASDGYNGAGRLILATLKRFYEFCSSEVGIVLPTSRPSFSIFFTTNIPRQVGLSGSSCIVTALLKCLISFYDIPDALVPKKVWATVALSVEGELGIAAGLQDRVVQMYDGVVAMDFTDKRQLEECGYGTYVHVDAATIPELHIVYAVDPSESGKMHSNVKQRWLQRDPEVVACAAQWISLVDRSLVALSGKEAATTLGLAMDENFNVRRKLYGDSCLGSKNIRMIEIVRSFGGHAKFAGSGGAIIAQLCHVTESSRHKLKEALASEGFVMVQAVLRNDCYLNSV